MRHPLLSPFSPSPQFIPTKALPSTRRLFRTYSSFSPFTASVSGCVAAIAADVDTLHPRANKYSRQVQRRREEGEKRRLTAPGTPPPEELQWYAAPLPSPPKGVPAVQQLMQAARCVAAAEAAAREQSSQTALDDKTHPKLEAAAGW
jgi:hypothetical protein